ncbi:MAG: Dickkopf N-terminal cysteine-rich domain-containing protein, partial [Myxococcota bacterium]|nr:Dickkopf N-terminal cysteine-rich domain-containing protein [Myxococcota bacterium]
MNRHWIWQSLSVLTILSLVACGGESSSTDPDAQGSTGNTGDTAGSDDTTDPEDGTATGDTCTAQQDCDDGFYCGTASANPTCKPVKGDGETCAEDFQCAGGTCDATSGTCGEACVGDGCACVAQEDCDAGFYCGTGGANPTCKAVKADGEACAEDFQCAGGTCDATSG